jgi:hypothetical protein
VFAWLFAGFSYPEILDMDFHPSMGIILYVYLQCVFICSKEKVTAKVERKS